MSCINDSLPFDALLQVLELLGSKDMVRSRRSCKKWKEILDENQLFWREPDLPALSRFKTGTALKLFDAKSGSQLRKVSLNIKLLEDRPYFQIEPLVETLCRSSSTLQVLHIHLSKGNIDEMYLLEELELPIDLISNLVDFRVSMRLPGEQTLYLSSKKQAIEAAESGQQRSKLKVLQLPHIRLLDSFSLPQTLFENLVSLKLEGDSGSKSEIWFLEPVTNTLKHLHITHISARASTRMHFPLLEVLEVPGIREFPNWISTPSSVRIIADRVLYGTPEVFSIWISVLDHSIRWLLTFSPSLQTLRIHLKKSPDLRDQARLYSTLRKRKEKVNSGVKIKEIKFEPLKKLIVPFDKLTPQGIEELKTLVEVVVDSALEPDFWEVEI